MERNLALELVRVTEAAALAAARENGRGDEMAPERVASEAMCRVFPDVGAQARSSSAIHSRNPVTAWRPAAGSGPADRKWISRSIRSRAA